MDLSKLPKLSDTQKANQEAHAQGAAGRNEEAELRAAGTPPAGEPVPYASNPAREGSLAADIWIALIVAIIFLWRGLDFGKWAAVTLTGGTYVTGVAWNGGPKNNQPVSYWELSGHEALTESGAFLYGLATLLEIGAMILVVRWPNWWRPLTLGVVAMVLMTVLYNGVVAAVFFAEGDLPILSLAIIAFGGYTVIRRWQALRGGIA